jgi:CHRD domain
MKKYMMVAVGVLATAGSGLAFSGDGNDKFRETLNGLKEAAAVISTTGSGTFRAEISRDETEINYELAFQDLEGDVRQAHIHIGLPQNSGGIVLWLCDSDLNPSPSTATPACTSDDPSNTHAGRVTGTLTAADVQSLAVNGIVGATATTPGEFAEVVALIRAGKTYVNIHSSKFPPGEIRSQIDRHDGNDDHEHGGR